MNKIIIPILITLISIVVTLTVMIVNGTDGILGWIVALLLCMKDLIGELIDSKPTNERR